MLVLTAPNMRGDDVAVLQGDLGRLGFDCGKVDGIFGPLTADALIDFQRNCGLVVDGGCGPITLQAITRVSRQSGDGPGVATMRERNQMQSRAASLRNLRIVIGQFGGLSALTRALARELRNCGALVMSVDEPDARVQADAANKFEADVYVGFATTVDGPSHVSYYSVPTFESAGGKALAERLARGLEPFSGFESDGCAARVQGMRLQVLRETRMPAVLISITEIRETVDLSVPLTAVVRDALEAWTAH